MEDQPEAPEQGDLLSEASDLSVARSLLADLHHELPEMVTRFRYLIDLGADLGPSGTMLFGGITSYYAWTEARSSFVHGNYVATILLCQSLMENLLAGFLWSAGSAQMSQRIQFGDTLDRCIAIGLLTADEFNDLKRLAGLRNPLTHFRDVTDQQNLFRRQQTNDRHALDILTSDAWFAISLAVRMLAKKPFRVG